MDQATPTHSLSPATPLESDRSSDLSTQDDRDSAIGDLDTASRQTQSITSSAYDYRYEGGRRYHAYEAPLYPLPNDEPEQDRLDLQHHAFRVSADGALHLAPIRKDIHSALDVGCGTGIWAIEFAEEHPSALVLGVDLSPIQPPHVPVNCSFRVDNVEADWVLDEKYDFIHLRAMILAIKDWPRLIEQAFRHLKPGGYIELQDFCLPTRCDDPAAAASSKAIKWGERIMEVADKMGMDVKAPLSWHRHLQAAGFVDIHSKWTNWPVGTWAKHRKNKELGRLAYADFYEAMASTVPVFQKVLGYTTEEAQVLLAEARKEFRDQKVHLYQQCCFCYARKPEDPAPSAPDTPIVPDGERLQEGF